LLFVSVFTPPSCPSTVNVKCVCIGRSDCRICVHPPYLSLNFRRRFWCMVREEIVFGDDEYLWMWTFVEHRGVEPDRHTNDQGVDDSDDDTDSDVSTARQEQHWLSE
jgi:hypothetical protein